MNYLYSTVNTLRDKYTPVSSTSTFRKTGQITPEEFLAAGDYLVFKFPTWSWADASPTSKRVTYLPPGKQFLVTRNVPCNRRLDEDFAGEAGHEGEVVDRGGALQGKGIDGDEDDGWLNTGGAAVRSGPRGSKISEVRMVDSEGNVGEQGVVDMDEDEIPDMEDDDDDEAIIRDVAANDNSGKRTYTLYIMYSTFYRTPRMYMSGYSPTGQPLSPHLMMDDIVGDYKDKTVTLEDFPFYANNIKMASVHPCKHASVMKTLLDRADMGLKIRREKQRAAGSAGGRPTTTGGMEGLVDEIDRMDVREATKNAVEAKPEAMGGAAAGSVSGDDWEEVGRDQAEEDEVAIRVDQYLVVFLKFIASVTPGIEHDFTMAV